MTSLPGERSLMEGLSNTPSSFLKLVWWPSWAGHIFDWIFSTVFLYNAFGVSLVIRRDGRAFVSDWDVCSHVAAWAATQDTCKVPREFHSDISDGARTILSLIDSRGCRTLNYPQDLGVNWCLRIWSTEMVGDPRHQTGIPRLFLWPMQSTSFPRDMFE